MRTPSIAALAVALVGCAAPDDLVSHGPTGYLSDRATEIVARTDLDTADKWRHAGSSPQAARPAMFWERAQTAEVSATGSRPFRITSFATRAEMRQVGNEPRDYASNNAVTFINAPQSAREAGPDYEALAQDGVIKVVAVFGQMGDGMLRGDDDGVWSMLHAVQLLGARRFSLEMVGSLARWSTTAPSGVRVEVTLVDPSRWPKQGQEEASEAMIAQAVSDAEIVYLNGHARHPALQALANATTWRPARYRIVVLDVCWSYFLYARTSLDAMNAAGARGHLVTSPGRVVTGSVGALPMLLDTVMEGTKGGDSIARRRTWLELLVAMNDEAELRAEARRGLVDETLRPPEVYGVSPVWDVEQEEGRVASELE